VQICPSILWLIVWPQNELSGTKSAMLSCSSYTYCCSYAVIPERLYVYISPAFFKIALGMVGVWIKLSLLMFPTDETRLPLFWSSLNRVLLYALFCTGPRANAALLDVRSSTQRRLHPS